MKVATIPPAAKSFAALVVDAYTPSRLRCALCDVKLEVIVRGDEDDHPLCPYCFKDLGPVEAPWPVRLLQHIVHFISHGR